ncbi:hypothetical protein T484DRAFT_1905571 [Baffinella frigidus]|nr:hypothetical protein T484DRAFT_1905571 [Cryptophyta sp. CCMP2293]
MFYSDRTWKGREAASHQVATRSICSLSPASKPVSKPAPLAVASPGKRAKLAPIASEYGSFHTLRKCKVLSVDAVPARKVEASSAEAVVPDILAVVSALETDSRRSALETAKLASPSGISSGGFFADPVPVPACGGSSKKLKDLKEALDANPKRACVEGLRFFGGGGAFAWRGV